MQSWTAEKRMPRTFKSIYAKGLTVTPFIWLSGASPDILNKCPSDVPKYVGLGGVVLTTAIIAGVSCAVALRMAINAHLLLCVLVGLIWSAMILNLDRWIVSSIQRQDTLAANLWITLPRLGLAVVLGAVISEPLVLWLFEEQIADELSVMQQERQAQLEMRLREDQRYGDIASMEIRALQLQERVDRGIDPGAVF